MKTKLLFSYHKEYISCSHCEKGQPTKSVSTVLEHAVNLSFLYSFRQIFHVLDLMTMDMVNFTIQSLRPHLQRNLIDYERAKFQDILEETPSMFFV